MSVFRGGITEYPGVIIDQFNSRNCAMGRAFFLSHCHKDHMSGLDSQDLLAELQQRKKGLYCSEVTRSILLRDPEFSKLSPYLETLPMEEPVAMTLKSLNDQSTMNITVTLLPAGHCPGSVMFLVEGSNGNILYTGDFRLSVEEVKHLSALHRDNKVLDLQTVYLDTTFCHPKSMNIPSRETSREAILQLTKKWLSEDPNNLVQLVCPTFGYEHILMAVAKQHNTKIHIAQWRINAYCDLPAVVDCLTPDGETTRIHCCNYKKKGKGLMCTSLRTNPSSVLTIKPSCQWFVMSSVDGGHTKHIQYIQNQNLYRVFHSMHASYSELIQFIKYVHPHTIVPCVIPTTLGDTSLTDLHSRLKHLLPQKPTLVNPVTTRNSSREPRISLKFTVDKNCIGEINESVERNRSDGFDTLKTKKAKLLPKLPAMLTSDCTHHSKVSPSVTLGHATLTFASHSEVVQQPILKLSFSDSNGSDVSDCVEIQSVTEYNDEKKCHKRRKIDHCTCGTDGNNLTSSGSLPLSCLEHTLFSNSFEMGFQEHKKVAENKERESSHVFGMNLSSSNCHSYSQSSSPSPLGSPAFLPPTPGKEDTTSILNRTGIGFM